MTAKTTTAVAVIGAGNGGLALGATAALRGAAVSICDVSADAVRPVRDAGGVVLLRGGEKTFVPFHTVSADFAGVVPGAALVLVVTPASAHAAVAAGIAPHLSPGAAVLLNPGRTGGALEVAAVFKKQCPEKKIIVAEAQTLLYSCRKTGPAEIGIKGEKNVVYLSAVPRSDTSAVLERVRPFFPAFAPANSIWETSFANIGAMFHPAPTLLNAGWIESTRGDFEYYMQGISPSVAALVEQLDQERLAVARAYGVNIPNAREWLHLAYGVQAPTLYEAIQANAPYRGVRAPASVSVRYLTEDVPTGLVPISELGTVVGCPTPIIDVVIAAASALLHTDFRKTGRNLDALGLRGLSAEEIVALA